MGQFFEPQRKSCDVRARNTLWTLFTLDDESKVGGGGGGNKPSSIGAAAAASSHQNSKKFGSFDKPVFEETENEEDFRDPENLEDDVVCDDDDNVDGDEIRSVRESHLGNSRNAVEFEVNNTGEIVEEEEAARVATLKIKDHIDLDNNQEKKSSGGGFWAAASVFSKKWQKWRRKQKIKKQNNGESFTTLPVEKPISRQYRETQSEIADYGYGRRSCDTDPRFSLDAGRMSFDDAARHSFDEPRASWDGYLMGKSFPRMAPMVSLMEDAPAVPRPDMHIPVEDDRHHPPPGGEGGVVPGGTMQTREYYLDSSCRRRKSLDRCSSTRKTAASVVAEIDELKMVSNAKVSPTTADCFHGARELRDSNSQSLREDSLELGGSGYRDYSNSSIGNGETKETKKSRRWSWRIWGFKFTHRRSGSGGGGGNKEDEDEEEEKYSRVNGVGRSLSVSWQDGRSDGGARLNINMFRSNSSVSCRNGGSFGSMRKASGEVSVPGKLERNRSARYSSPSHVENGMWRFYLTPMRGSRRGGIGGGKIKHNNSNSIARSVLRLY